MFELDAGKVQMSESTTEVHLWTEDCITEDMGRTATRCGQEVSHQLLQASACLHQHWWLTLWTFTVKIYHSHTHTHTQPFYCSMDFVRDNPGEPVPEETFTHSHVSWSSIVPFLLHPSNTIHGILPVQSTCLAVFLHNLCPSFLWSTSWPGILHLILHTFLHPIIVFFSQHMLIPLQPFLL